MKKIMKNKIKLVAGFVAVFAVMVILFGFNASKTANACSTGCYPPVSGYCKADVTEANIGDTVTFKAYGQGGLNLYAYTWTGENGLTSNNYKISPTYSTSGTKTVYLKINSNGQDYNTSCSVYIKPVVIVNPCDNGSCVPPSVVCYANPTSVNVGDQVAYTANANIGGAYNNNVTYSWSGDEGLYGTSQTIYKTYSYSGNKSARVTVYANGQSASASCPVYVQTQVYVPPPVYVPPTQNLTAYCVANPTQSNINQSVTYTVYPSGGNNYNNYNNNNFNGYNSYPNNNSNYYYSWTGTDSLYGNSQTIYKTYNTSGSKNAVVTVSVNGQSVSATCYTNIQDVPVTGVIYTPPSNPQGGVYLDTIPATGISPTVKTSLFLAGTLIWSAFLGYLYVARRNMKLKEQKMIQDAWNS